MSSLPFRTLLASSLLALALAACSKNDDSSQGSPGPSQIGNIYLDSGLTAQDRTAFSDALAYLDENPANNTDPELLQYMHIDNFDPASVHHWVEERVQYIVPQNFDLNSLQVIKENYNGFANPGVVPPALQGPLTKMVAASAPQGHIVMSNIGAMIYLIGKSKNLLLGVPATGLGNIAMTSPRSGVLEVGDGLYLIPDQYPNVVKIFHLTTLIHESHHSDGNGLTTGFLHATCPSGTYQGLAACDHNLNGPYEIEAMATKAFLTSCAACSLKELAILKELYLDTVSRRIDDDQTTVWDDAPEGHRE